MFRANECKKHLIIFILKIVVIKSHLSNKIPILLLIFDKCVINDNKLARGLKELRYFFISFLITLSGVLPPDLQQINEVLCLDTVLEGDIKEVLINVMWLFPYDLDDLRGYPRRLIPKYLPERLLSKADPALLEGQTCQVYLKLEELVGDRGLGPPIHTTCLRGRRLPLHDQLIDPIVVKDLYLMLIVLDQEVQQVDVDGLLLLLG